MKVRTAALTISLAAALVAPSAASAATVGVVKPKPCYGGGDILQLAGTGFRPNTPVGFLFGTLASPTRVPANPGGAFLAGLRVPFFTSPSQVISGVSAADGSNFATVPVTLSAFRVSVRPANASPYRTRRFAARGFTAGKTLYRHILRGRRVSNSRQARLKGACHTRSYTRRLFRRTARTGTYRVQFDTKRKYSSRTVQRVRFRVRVYRIVRRASAATSSTAPVGRLGESWTRVK